jgi:hypothetical protein
MNDHEKGLALAKAFGLSTTPRAPAAPVNTWIQKLGEGLGVLAPPPFSDHADVVAARAQAIALVAKYGGDPERMRGFVDAHVETVRARTEAASKVTK